MQIIIIASTKSLVAKLAKYFYAQPLKRCST